MSQLYMTATSDTSKPVSKRGNQELEVKLFYGGAKKSTQAVKVRLEYDPTTKRTWLVIEGPHHNEWNEHRGTTSIDISRRVLPE